jgi:hypothetical protein
MLGALKNVHPSHLLDRSVARVAGEVEDEDEAGPAGLVRLRIERA